MMIAFRKRHPSIGRATFWRDDVLWYGTGKDVDMGHDSHTLALYLDGTRQGDSDIYVMINTYWEAQSFQIMEWTDRSWKRVIDTALADGCDIVESEAATPVGDAVYTVRARSVVVLEREWNQG